MPVAPVAAAWLGLNLLCYVILCGLVFRWGRRIYGLPAAVAATALVAFLPRLLGQIARPMELVDLTWMFAAAYAIVRCLLDPTVQWAVLAGVATGVSLVIADRAIWLLPFSGLAIICRGLTAEHWEPHRRVWHGSIGAVLITWAVAAVITNGLVAVASEVSSIGAAVSRSGIRDTDTIGSTLGQMPVILLLLACTRRWRWERRYTDAVLVASILCLAVSAEAYHWGTGSGDWILPALPFIALLAAGNWDSGRNRWSVRFATALLAVHLVVTLIWWSGELVTGS